MARFPIVPIAHDRVWLAAPASRPKGGLPGAASALALLDRKNELLPPLQERLRTALVDTVGELSMLYAAADVAFVGGSLVPVGGHNLLEPAALGVPVLSGPYQANALEIARQLFAAGAAFEVADSHALADALRRLLAEPDRASRAGASGRRVIDANRGSVAGLLRLIEPLVEPAVPSGAR